MTGTARDFTVGGHPEIAVTVLSTDVVVSEGPGGSIRVEIDGSDRELDSYDVLQTGDVVVVRARKGARRWIGRGAPIRLTVPAMTSVRARTASGDLTFSAPISDFEIDSASGDIHLNATSGRGRLKIASGDVTVGDVAGDFRVSSASGDVRIDRLEGDASLNTASGDVEIGAGEGSIKVKTASGDVVIRRFSGANLEGLSMSGDVVVGLAPGMAIDADIQTRSGKFRNLVVPQAGNRSISAVMRIRTLSGDVTLR